MNQSADTPIGPDVTNNFYGNKVKQNCSVADLDKIEIMNGLWSIQH